MASTTVASSTSPSIGLSFSKLVKLSPVLEKSMEEISEQLLPEHLKTFTQIIETIGFLNNDANVFNQLRAMFPTVEVGSLTKLEQCLANLFKCDDYHHNCFFSAGTEAAFQHHLSQAHSSQSLYCFYCTKSGHQENCSYEVDHTVYNQPEQLVSLLLSLLNCF